MTAEEEDPHQEKPYSWDESAPPPQEVLTLWQEVGNGIDKNQTVVWKSAVESLDHALKFLRTSPDSRAFVEKYMGPIIGILVEQQPAKIGHHERNCVQESLALSVQIVAEDLEIQLARNGECLLLNDTLSHVFNKKKAFYKGGKTTWNVSHLQGLPEVRLRMAERFQQQQGFVLLERYLMQKTGTTALPKFDPLHHILQVLADSIPNNRKMEGDRGALIRQMEEEAIAVAKAIMHYISTATDDALKKMPTDQLSYIQHDLQRLFDRLVTTQRTATYEFYHFWRQLVLRLITSQSLPLKLFGWEHVNDLIDASADHRPPPRSFVVSGAGCPFVNGSYDYAAEVTPEGYAKPGCDTKYVRKIPETEEPGGGKKLTLFRCTMRSQQKWWFLSEADEEQPGTDRDIDYYQHKSKEHEESFPPPGGWITCRSAGIDPPPALASKGLLVPEGEHFNTLEHQLAKWAIENEIVEKVLGDTTIHREVVARSTGLIKFLASMCSRDQPNETMTDGMEPNKYCLSTSHLLFAWKTCTRKADAAVSAQVYQLLVQILPLCPSDRAIPLVKAVQKTLEESEAKPEYLSEVAEFLTALATANHVDAKTATGPALSDEVREDVLSILWSVLTHSEASSLKSYDNLKRYVTYELRVEPKGSEHREKFLKSCIAALSANAEKHNAQVEEMQALRMVKLTHFVLEACPRQQADKIVMDESTLLPVLLFRELVAYLERRKRGTGIFRKASTQSISQALSAAAESDSKLHWNALNERLRILRHVYGLSDPRAGTADPIVMSSEMLEQLWKLCEAPEDREALMIFIASASHSGKVSHPEKLPQASTANSATTQSEHVLSAAFTEEVCRSVFLNLFCSPSFSYDQLGEGAYRSFQFLFNTVRQSPLSSMQSKKASLDALWRVCLTAIREWVASQAMKDLLSVYVSMSTDKTSGDPLVSPDQMATDENDESFGDRIFQCLSQVKRDLDAKDASSERSAQRCLRILNAAIGQIESEGYSMTSSTLVRLSRLPPNASLSDAIKCLPHGMRGQACYRKVGIIAKRPQAQNQPSQQPYEEREAVSGQVRPGGTLKFTLDVHPLETLASIKYKVSVSCQCPLTAVKPIQINGRAVGTGNRSNADPTHLNLNVVPEDSVMDELGVVQGCEIVFVIAERPMQSNGPVPAPRTSRSAQTNDLSSVFFSDDSKFADQLFSMLLGILDSLPWKEQDEMTDTDTEPKATDAHKLVWDLLLAMPTNTSIASRVKSAHGRSGDEPSVASEDDAMDVDSAGETWSHLLDTRNFNRSVYVLLTVDAFLQPAPEALTILPAEQRLTLEKRMVEYANSFRRAFIDWGGFRAAARFFSASEGHEKTKQGEARRGNAVALRILKSCLFGDTRESPNPDETANSSDEASAQLLQSLSDPDGLLKSLTAMVVDDRGISSSTVMDVLRFLRLLFQSPRAAQSFVLLPDIMAERFIIILLWWNEDSETRTSSSISTTLHVRRTVHDLILQTPVLADSALPWLISGVERINVTWDHASEHFDVLEKLVSYQKAGTRKTSDQELRDLGAIVCKKLASCPRPTSESEVADLSTGVLCGCLKLLRALVENGGGNLLRPGTDILLTELKVSRWSETVASQNKGMLAIVPSPFSSRPRAEDLTLIDLMGAIFDGFLCPGESSSVGICCDKESRRRGFDVVGAAARSCKGSEGYLSIVNRVNELVSSAVPNIRHRWGQFGGISDSHSRSVRSASKYSGLRNQGCTCYMNSVLQQLFMMPELRDSMCAAPLPASLRSSGSVVSSKGAELVGEKIQLQWDTGVSYDAIVEAFDKRTGMHTVRYCDIQVATVGGSGHHQVQPEDISRLPPSLPDEFILSEGRPGKETGVYEIVSETQEESELGGDAKSPDSKSGNQIKETEDEASSRHLLEEVQRTFIHLEEGSKGRCFDPRALVEACHCLKLEFDVWQQNDASEFATKLLDRLEISLKRWAPSHFQYMDHTFGLKQTKQKICKECGLKTNREEKLMNIDCQIRGKSDIHEALAAMTEDEIMEGSNKVFCDSCKKNTDTVLRTAISALPNMLILSLKRFDLDYNTFETIKLNSRCAFGQTLNMKQYTLEGLEAVERAGEDEDVDSGTPMDTEESQPKAVDDAVDDEEYGYKLVGVLVHAGVAQGGHYYSFIKDRNPGSEEKWYRFDDEDVTPFDPSLIETECFGGKVKKETKWPNGQVHTVEQEQFANALMLFYEKVKPSDPPAEADREKEETCDAFDRDVPISSGYDVFEPDVRRSNATHRWQSFLFDSEFHVFLKALLGFCRLSCNQQVVASSQGSEIAWRESVVQMLLDFVFDVLLYSSERASLNEWTRMLEETLLFDRRVAVSFVHKLARKTGEVSGNWLRTYLMECPDQSSRMASVRVFTAAMKACASTQEEAKALSAWTYGWRDQLDQISTEKREGSPLPYCLERTGQSLEDVQKLGSGGASSLGIIISFVNVLLAAMPRQWRFSGELGLFIRDLASMAFENGERLFLRPMIEALVPARLICLIVRDRVPLLLRVAFPGASIAPEVANTQIRAESNPNAHVMPMGGNQVLNASDMNSPRGPNGSDYLMMLEALACLAGLPGAIHAPLVRDAEELSRGRPRYTLSDDAAKALSIVFHECCAPGAPGMGQREIELYLHRCGVDTGNVPTQKIVDMLSKYPTTTGGPGKGSTYLSLEGFLAYYKDTVQSNDMRARLDLHTFGFRPDLSRRSRDARFVSIGDRESDRKSAESVAIDVAETFKDRPVDLGQLANLGLAGTVTLYSLAYNVCEPLAEYLVAAATYRKDAEALTNQTLQLIYRTPNDWGGNEAVSACVNVLMVIASNPGQDQEARISKIMQSTVKAARNVEHGAGLLQVVRAFYRARSTQHYSNDMHWAFERYITILKDLRRIYPIFKWMNENREQWNFIERELLDSRSAVAHHHSQIRNDHGTRDAENAAPLDHHSHTDSDMAGMNDSEDEDSQFERVDSFEVMPNEGPYEIMLTSAGNPAVNGVYSQNGYFESACRYVKDGKWNGQPYKFYIFKCNVSNNTQHWYISIVPYGGNPGTSSDIDFYTAPVNETCIHVPPVVGWAKSTEGRDPPPILSFLNRPEEGEESPETSPERMWNGGIVEDDENQEGPSPYI